MAYRLEKTSSGADIVIDGFEKGIAESPYDGISDMRNMDIISVPSEASVGFQTSQVNQSAISAVAFTVTAVGDTFTYNGAIAIKVGTSIVLNTLVGGTGLALATNYWIVAATATTFTVSASVATTGIPGAVLNVTLDGSGTFSTVNVGQITQMAQRVSALNVTNGTTTVNSSQTTTYGIDDMNRAWVFVPSTPNWVYLGNPNTYVSAVSNTGIAVFNSYILVFQASQIDYIVIGGSSWTSNWKSLNSAVSHRTFTDRNGTLYWCDANSIGSLIELTTFDPTTSSTYTISINALTIPDTEFTQCIEQLGTNLLIGSTGNTIYVWDRFSTGYTPLFLPENDTKRIVAVNSNAYFFTGNRGRIYITNGANVQLVAKVPDHLSGTISPYFSWGGATYNKNQVYFSISAMNSASQTAISQYTAIWAISTNTNALRVVNRLSYGTYAGFISEIITSFDAATVVSGGGYDLISILAAWYSGTVYGCDWTSNSPTPYSNYEAYVDSDMIPIGTYLNPTTDANVEFKLTVPLVSGEGVKLAYRQNLSQSFTDITGGEFTTAGIFSGKCNVNFQKSQWLQIRAYTKSTSTTPSYTRLKELRIRQ